MQPQTKEIVTKAGTKFVLNESITYGQHREITNIYLTKKDDIAISSEADKRGVEIVVVSIDGVTENIYDKFLSLPFADIQEVLKEIRDVINPKV